MRVREESLCRPVLSCNSLQPLQLLFGTAVRRADTPTLSWGAVDNIADVQQDAFWETYDLFLSALSPQAQERLFFGMAAL